MPWSMLLWTKASSPPVDLQVRLLRDRLLYLLACTARAGFEFGLGLVPWSMTPLIDPRICGALEVVTLILQERISVSRPEIHSGGSERGSEIPAKNPIILRKTHLPKLMWDRGHLLPLSSRKQLQTHSAVSTWLQRSKLNLKRAIYDLAKWCSTHVHLQTNNTTGCQPVVSLLMNLCGHTSLYSRKYLVCFGSVLLAFRLLYRLASLSCVIARWQPGSSCSSFDLLIRIVRGAGVSVLSSVSTSIADPQKWYKLASKSKIGLKFKMA